MQKTQLASRSVAKILDNSRNRHVWVIGDVFLDDYIEGNIERISPEAPVQIINVSNQFYRLGGAANAANNLSALGAQVTLGGIIGCDSMAHVFMESCAQQDIGTECIIATNDRPTIRKLRVMSNRQQVIRLDWECIKPIDTETEKRLLDAFTKAAPPDAILLSDYGKGVLTDSVIQEFMKIAREKRVPVVVDPKFNRYERYNGASVITPNLKEFQEASGQKIDPNDDESIAKSARHICERDHIDSMLVTLGEFGMVLWTPEGGIHRVATMAREVYDVTGAGDTVVATLAFALAGRTDLMTATIIANAAAGVVVGKSGTSTVRPDELIKAISPNIEDKILDNESLIESIRCWRLLNKRVVFTNGCFDLLHVGHLHLLNQAAALGDILLVGINSDTSIRRIKGPDRPLIPEHERAALVSALDRVTAVVLFDEDTPLELIKQVKPDLLVKGSDYRIDQVVGREEVEALGGRVVLVDLLPNLSTSLLIGRIRNGRLTDD
jgi:D-beta-D-heptose 7-phosphate kinase / D-beta-D-heptose 1-phosphate adenosyltransferase